MRRLFLPLLGILAALCLLPARVAHAITCSTTVTVLTNSGGATPTTVWGTNLVSAANFACQLPADTNGNALFPASAALTTSALAIPTTTVLGSALYGYNGTTLDLLKDDASKNLLINCNANCGLADEAAFTAATTIGSPIMGWFQTTPTTSPCTTGQVCTVQETADRALMVSPFDTTGGKLSAGIGAGTAPSSIEGVPGAVFNTTPPSLSNGQSAALQADPNGALIVAGRCTGVINIAQTATTDVHTFTGFGKICSIVLVSATAQNIGIQEGTGTTCQSSGTALLGVSATASNTAQMAVAANGGFSAVSATPWLSLQTSADHLCVDQSSTGEVAGTITYQDVTNK